MNALSRFAMTLAASALLPLTGCGHIQTPVLAFNDDGQYLPGDVGEGLVTAPNPLIPDVPMPVGFKAVPSQSNWHYNGQVRVVRHVYQGQAKTGDAAAFYQLYLPENNWSLVDIQAVGDSTVMNYNKGPETLTVTANQGWGVTTVTIDIQGR